MTVYTIKQKREEKKTRNVSLSVSHYTLRRSRAEDVGKVFLAPVTASAQSFFFSFFTPFSSSQAWLSRLRFGLVRQETVKGVDSAGTEALIAFCCLFPEPPTSTYATTDILTFKAFLSLRCNVSFFFSYTLCSFLHHSFV